MYTGVGFSFLDDMTLDELEALQSIIAQKISSIRAVESTKTQSFGMWTIKYYVDEFDQLTDNGFVTNTQEIYGTFCNSAVEDRKLRVMWALDKEYVTLFLYEYGDNLVKGTGNRSTTYNVTMRGTSGKDIKLSATLGAYDDRLYFTESSGKKIREEFAKNGKVSFYIVNSRWEVETYLFTVNNTSYFTNAWNKLTNRSSTNAGNKNLKQGDSSAEVLRMKTRMQELGYFSTTASLSDKFTSTTTERVKLFQKVNGLPQTGVADATTLSILYSEKAKKNPY